MRPVDLNVAGGAIADTRVGEVVEGGRNAAGGGGRHAGEIGVTLEALLRNLRTSEHARIGGSVRFVARGTAFHAHGRVFEGEGAAFVAMAAEASGLIAGYIAEAIGEEPAVRVVAIDASDAAFLKLVAEGPLELGYGGDVAGAAIGDVVFRLRLVNRVATGAGHLIAGVAAADGADARGLFQMAAEANSIGLRSRQTEWVTDVAGCGRFRMGASWPMTAFARFFDKAVFGFGFHPIVWILCKCLKNFFVAALANDASHEFGRGFFFLPH